jgi:predicted DCC family thiol-disulfide oxidoreductase YuxK
VIEERHFISRSISVITEISNKTDNTVAGWLLYDGRCGLCSAGARRSQSLLRRLGLRPATLQSTGRSGSGELMLLTRDGQVLGGVEAYLYVADQLWWSHPLARVGRLPPIYRALCRVYRSIAAHRRRISTVCHLQPDLSSPETEVADDRRLLH